jgi:hypothetical protein
MEHLVYPRFRIVYVDKKHKSDRSLSIWADTPDQALEKYKNTKYALNNKPFPGFDPRIFTEAEFAQLKPYYLIFQENKGKQFCYIMAEDAASAETEFAKRFTVKPLEVLTKDEFRTSWESIQAAKQALHDERVTSFQLPAVA